MADEALRNHIRDWLYDVSRLRSDLKAAPFVTEPLTDEESVKGLIPLMRDQPDVRLALIAIRTTECSYERHHHELRHTAEVSPRSKKPSKIALPPHAEQVIFAPCHDRFRCPRLSSLKRGFERWLRVLTSSPPTASGVWFIDPCAAGCAWRRPKAR